MELLVLQIKGEVLMLFIKYLLIKSQILIKLSQFLCFWYYFWCSDYNTHISSLWKFCSLPVIFFNICKIIIMDKQCLRGKVCSAKSEELDSMLPRFPKRYHVNAEYTHIISMDTTCIYRLLLMSCVRVHRMSPLGMLHQNWGD